MCDRRMWWKELELLEPFEATKYKTGIFGARAVTLLGARTWEE